MVDFRTFGDVSSHKNETITGTWDFSTAASIRIPRSLYMPSGLTGDGLKLDSAAFNIFQIDLNATTYGSFIIDGGMTNSKFTMTFTNNNIGYVTGASLEFGGANLTFSHAASSKMVFNSALNNPLVMYFHRPDASILANDAITTIYFSSNDDAAFNPCAKIYVSAVANFTSVTDQDTSMKFYTQDGAAGDALANPVLELASGQNIGFFNTAPAGQQTIVGAKAGNVALANLLTGLANLGLIIDNTTP